MHRIGQVRPRQGLCTCREPTMRVKLACAVVLLIPVLLLFSLCDRPIRRIYWLPCAGINCNSAATLANAPLYLLRDRRWQHNIEVMSDYFELNGKSASDLPTAYFDIPKVIHQVWLGQQEPPLAWINSWRYMLSIKFCRNLRMCDSRVIVQAGLRSQVYRLESHAVDAIEFYHSSVP